MNAAFSRPVPKGALFALTISAGIILGATPAIARCPAGYEQQQRHQINAHYIAESQKLHAWQDQRIRAALDRKASAHATAAPETFAKLHEDRAAHAERVRSAGPARQHPRRAAARSNQNWPEIPTENV